MRIRPGFLALLAVVAVFGVMKALPKGEGKAGARTARAADPLGEEDRRGARGRRSARPLSPPVVDLAALDREGEGRAFAIGRNLFRYAPPKAPEAPPAAGPGGRPFPGRPGAKPSEPPPETNLTPPPPVQPSPPPRPRPPALTVRYLGAFGPEGRMLAVFTDGAEIYDVFEGETFADRYVLRRIDLETVVIGFQGFPDDITEKLEVGP